MISLLNIPYVDTLFTEYFSALPYARTDQFSFIKVAFVSHYVLTTLKQHTFLGISKDVMCEDGETMRIRIDEQNSLMIRVKYENDLMIMNGVEYCWWPYLNKMKPFY